MRVEKLKAAYDIETVLVHFPLHPDTPVEGRSMAEFYATRGIDPEQSYQRMKQLMDAEGLPYGTAHPHLQQPARAGAWQVGRYARPAGKRSTTGCTRRISSMRRTSPMSICWSISPPSVGLPADEARAVLDERRFKDAVDADWEKSHRYGVTGVPTFVAARYGVVGRATL